MCRFAMTVAVTGVVLLCISGAQAVAMVRVRVGNPGNTADTRYETPGYGGVSYTYSIGMYEVKAEQYKDFLNEVGVTDSSDPYGLYNAAMDNSAEGCKIYWNSTQYEYDVRNGYGNRPVNYVSWYDAIRFANWLTSGDTEGGSYTITNGGPDAGDVGVPDADERAQWVQGTTRYFLLPSEDEWYKAAYHKNDGATANYFDYPTSNDSVPGRDMTKATNPGNNANRWGVSPYPIDAPYYTTIAGEFELSDSPYGTFDQGGNVWEWNEAVIGSGRGIRGASFSSGDGSGSDLHASYRGENKSPTFESNTVGFRVAFVPEPATIVMLALASVGIIRRTRG